jgi:tryptophan halogenase
LIEAAAYMIASLFPRSGGMERAAAHFNHLMSRRYERIADFIKMHYFLTQRTDSAFWRDNARPQTAADSLLAMLEMWRQRPPGRFDFIMDYETFATANYQFVLYGMGFETDLSANRASYPQAARAREEFAHVARASSRAVTALPPHRELLQQVYRHGFRFADSPDHQPAPTTLIR